MQQMMPQEMSYGEPTIQGYPQPNSIAQMVAEKGRGTDTMAAHVSPDDMVIPRQIWEKDPAILVKIKKLFEEEGADYRDHIVGNGVNNINPETGLPEFKLFGKFGKFFVQALASAVAGPAGGMIAGGLYDARENMKAASDAKKQAQQQAQAGQLDLSTPSEMALPGSLSGTLGGLTPMQRTTNIATQGVEGGGASSEGRDYFINQVQRRLADSNVENDPNAIEQNYLRRLGVGFDPTNTRSILEGIARRKQSGWA